MGSLCRLTYTGNPQIEIPYYRGIASTRDIWLRVSLSVSFIGLEGCVALMYCTKNNLMILLTDFWYGDTNLNGLTLLLNVFNP